MSRANYYLSPNLSVYASNAVTGTVDVTSVAPVATWNSELQFADELEANRAQALYWESLITPTIAAQTVKISQEYPWLSPGVVTGAAFAGIEADNPALKWLADREAVTADSGGIGSMIGSILGTPFTMFKGATRFITTGFDMLWEEGLTRPLRTGVGSYQGRDLGDAYQRAGASIGTRAIGDLFGGEGDLDVGDRLEAFVRNVTPAPSLPGQEVNLGSGYLPTSNLADTNDRQVQALTELLIRQGLPPARASAQAIQSVQQSYGRPISQQARFQAETGTRVTDKFGNKVSISPGRLAAVGFGMDSDTSAFNVVSGIGDFAAQIFLDPSNIALMGLSKARLASRLLTRGSRTSRVFGQDVDKFTSSAFYGQQLLPSLTAMTSPTQVMKALKITRSGAKGIRSRRLVSDIVNSKTDAATDAVLRPHLGTTVRKSPKPENIANIFGGYKGKTVGQRVGGSETFQRLLGGSADEIAQRAEQAAVFGLKVGVQNRLSGTWVGRLFEETSGRIIDTTNMDKAFFQFDNFLTNSGLDIATKDDLLMQAAKLGDEDHTGMFQVVKGAMAAWKKKVVVDLIAAGEDPKYAEKWAGAFTHMFNSQDDFVKYWISQGGNSQVFQSGHVKVIANGEMHMMEMRPTVHLISEMVVRQIPMPDPREMRRLLSEVSSFPLAKLTAKRTLKHGTDAEFEGRVMTNVTDLYMQKIWKPMVLLRFAWPVRVIGEEQFRLAASGKMSAINHPMQWLAFATGRKGNRTLMDKLPSPDDISTALRKGAKGEKIDIPKGLEDFYGALASGDGGWLNSAGQIVSVAGYSTVRLGDPNYVEALVWNMAKLKVNAGILQKMNNEGIDATAAWLHSGKGQPLLLKLRDAQDASKLMSYNDVHIYLQSVAARQHVTAGGGYIWFDEAAFRWRDHFDQFLAPDVAPPPPRGLDPNQSPLPGMRAEVPKAEPRPQPAPGLGEPPYVGPGYGRQGQFDTDFQPRIQREMQGDYRIIDALLHGDRKGTQAGISQDAAEAAFREGQVPGVFGDSVPLDRTWGQYSGATDVELTSKLGESLRDWSGDPTFDKLGYVDETLDLLFQEFRIRFGSATEDAFREKMRATIGQRVSDPREAQEVTEAVVGLAKQYEQVRNVETIMNDLDRIARPIGEAQVSGLRTPFFNTTAALDDSATGQVVFISSLLDQIASSPTHVGISEALRYIDEALELAARNGGDSPELLKYVAQLRKRVERVQTKSRHPESFKSKAAPLSDEGFVAHVEYEGKVTYASRGEQNRVTEVYMDSTSTIPDRNFDKIANDVAHETTHGLNSPSKNIIETDRPTVSFMLSEVLASAGTVNRTPLVKHVAGGGARAGTPTTNIRRPFESLNEMIAQGIRNMAPKGSTLDEGVKAAGYRVVADAEGTRLVKAAGFEAEQAGQIGWHVPNKAIADENSQLIHGALFRSITSEDPAAVIDLRSVAQNIGLAGDDAAARDYLAEAAASIRNGYAKENRGVMTELVDAESWAVTNSLSGGTTAPVSTRTAVSEILQYGQTWKGSTLHDGDAAIMWSSEIDDIVKEMSTRRLAALSEGKLDEFDDQVLDAIYEIAESLGSNPNRIMEEFDEALAVGEGLSQAKIAMGTQSYNSPMGQPVIPQSLLDEMENVAHLDPVLSPTQRAAAWDELEDDASVFVYAWMSQDEAHRIATVGWDGGPLVVSSDPNIAAFFTVPLIPSGQGLPALGHARMGDELTGVLVGDIGESAGNLLGPGLYTASQGEVLGGYTSKQPFLRTSATTGELESGVPSVTQIMWTPDRPPRTFDLQTPMAESTEYWEGIIRSVEELRTSPGKIGGETLAGFVDDDYAAITTFIQRYLDDPTLTEFSYHLHAAIGTANTRQSILLNEAVYRSGYDALRHQGGVARGGDQHEVFIWLWGTMRDGNVSGAKIKGVGTDDVARRARGRRQNTNKLVSMRVQKSDVTPSFKGAPDQTTGEALSAFGMGGQINRNIDPGDTRFVSHSPTQPNPVTGELEHVTSGIGLERVKPDMAHVKADEVKILEEARARGLRVQFVRSANDQGVVVSVSGKDGTRLEATFGSPSVERLVVDGQEVPLSALNRELQKMRPSGTDGVFTSKNRTTASKVGSIKALDELPEAEAAVLRNALNEMPHPYEKLSDLPDTNVLRQDIEPPALGPPSPTPLDFTTEGSNVPEMFVKTGAADEGMNNLMLKGKHTIGEGENATVLKMPGEWDETSPELRSYIENLAAQGKTPDKMPYRNLDVGDDARNGFDKALNVAFYHAMSRPTNFLSRAPAWKQSYIQRVLELRGFAVPKVQAQIDELLYKPTADGGFGLTNRNVRQISGKDPVDVEDFGGTIKSMRTVDDLAKSFALEETKDLLYDATRRRNITDITRNIFPFAEAWSEVIGVWSRIAFEHPEVLRRAQQGLEGARDSGIFYTNDNGEEVFAYPGLDLLGNWMLGTDLEGGGVEFTGRTAGVNIALGGFLPGFGPVIQLPVSMAADHMPVGWDWVEELVLPFGGSDTNFTPGSILNIGLPTWYRRGLEAFGVGGPEYEQRYFNTVIDTFKLKTLDDPRILNDPALAQSALKESFKDAKMIGILRTFATFFLPTGPQITFKAGDVDGKNWTFQALTSEYYTILARNDFDSFEAYREFKGRFGFDPTTFTTAKSVQVIKLPSTKSGDIWFRENEDLFDFGEFPTTAAYSMPDLPWDEFDYGAYTRQLEADARQGVSPQVWVMRRNQLLGNLQYENARELIAERTDEPALQWLRQIRIDLTLEYPGFGLQQIPGVPGRATLDQKLLELSKWTDEPRLAESSAGKGLSVYFDLRKQAQTRSMEHGFSPNGFQTAKKMSYIRDWLREEAAIIMAQYPDFSTLWFDVFARELEEANAQDEPLTLAGLSFKETA